MRWGSFLGVHVNGHHHRAGWIADGAQDGERANDHEVCVVNDGFGLRQQCMKLFAVQRNSRSKNEKGVFCIIPSERRSDASSTFCL